MWKNRSVLITGASGLVGSHMLDELTNQKANIVCLLRDWIPASRYYRRSVIIETNEAYGDVEDFDLVSRVINEYQVQTVFHLAAQTQVGIANKNPLPTLRTNIMGTVNVLEACRINKVEQVLIASSDKAYGDHVWLPYDETTPLRGLHPYDVSKSCTDLIAQTYAKSYGLQVGITRCGNLFGPGDLNFNRLIPGTIQSLLAKEAPIIRSDGLMTRDYFYVKDAVHAYMMLAEYIHQKGITPGIYNFSYGKPYSTLQMVELIQRVMGTNLVPVIQNQASNEIKEQFLNSAKAREEIKWSPKWTLEQALKETVEWYKVNA